MLSGEFRTMVIILVSRLSVSAGEVFLSQINVKALQLSVALYSTGVLV